jgi:intracellular sulfur oxidation DsrE/DsrF family protein
MFLLRSFVVAAALLAATAAYADPPSFSPGPVIAEYGAVADVEGAAPIPPNTRFKVVFDVSEAAAAGAVNRRLESAARFLNMHVRAGVPRQNIRLAIVVHGAAARELTRPSEGETNANAGLIAALIANGVDIYLCGQAAARYDIGAEDLLPGVRLSLSAMTAHALLQQDGYTLNPF